jgi:hypothetical protein
MCLFIILEPEIRQAMLPHICLTVHAKKNVLENANDIKIGPFLGVFSLLQDLGVEMHLEMLSMHRPSGVLDAICCDDDMAICNTQFRDSCFAVSTSLYL